MSPETNGSTLPPGTHIGRTALRVADLEPMTDFYRRVVGLGVLERDADGATLGVDGTPLLVLEHDPDAPERPRTAAGLYHTAFRLPSRAALGDALERVREHWQLDGASDHLVSEALYLTDPEGNGVEIYRDFPREEWPMADDGTVLMATDPLDLEAVAAAAGGADRAPAGTDVGHVHLEITSVADFRSVYVDALGFVAQAGVPEAAFVSAGGYHHHVGANSWHGRSTPAEGRGLAWFEVVVPSADALGPVRDRLDDAGISMAETDGGLTVTEPDDIAVRLRVAM